MKTDSNAPGPGVNGYARPIVVFTRADMVRFAPTDWLIEHWLVRNSLAGLVGPSGAGKSFLAIDWACRVATGSAWLGNRAKRGAVFYLAGEGQAGIRKRIAAWEGYHGVSMDGHPLYVADTLPFLTDELQTAGTVAAIEALEDDIFFNCGGADPALVIVDTVARAMGGANENDAGDMGRLVGAMDWFRSRWGACVLAVHHTGHAEGGRARGSSAFKAALDSEFLLTTKDAEVKLAVSKAKDWESPAPVVLEKHIVPVEIVGTDGNPLRDSSLILRPDNEAALTEFRRRQAYKLRKDGLSYREIASEIGVSKSAVERWLGSEANAA